MAYTLIYDPRRWVRSDSTDVTIVLPIVAGGTGNTTGTATVNANLTGPITSTGNATAIASQTGTGTKFVMDTSPTIAGHETIEGVTATGATGTGKFVFDTSPVLVGPALGTPASGVATNLTGTAASLTAGTATNATNTAITDDTTTNATMYPTWVTANTGNLPQKVTSTKFSFNPSTGTVTHTVGNTAGVAVSSSNSGFLEVGKTGATRWWWTNDYNSAGIFELLVGVGGATPTATLMSMTTTGALALTIVGGGFQVKEGSNATMGTATLVLGVKVVSTTKVTANSRIFLTVESLGTVTVPTVVAVTARSAGTSFTITSSNLTDTSVVAWIIFEPS